MPARSRSDINSARPSALDVTAHHVDPVVFWIAIPLAQLVRCQRFANKAAMTRSHVGGISQATIPPADGAPSAQRTPAAIYIFAVCHRGIRFRDSLHPGMMGRVFAGRIGRPSIPDDSQGLATATAKVAVTQST